MSRSAAFHSMVARRRDTIAGEAQRQTSAEDPVAAALGQALSLRAGTQSLQGRPHVNRATAMGLPVTWRCCTMISEDIGGLDVYASDGRYWPLLVEPEPGTPRLETIAGTVLDLILHGNVVWSVLMRDGRGVPAAVRVIPTEDLWIHIDPRTKRIDQYRWRTMTLDPMEVIHFRGPAPAGWPVGISPLVALEQTVGNLIGQEQAAAEMLISGWLPLVVLSPRDPDQGLTDEEVSRILDAWTMRAGRGRGPVVVPGEVQASTLSFDPRRLQLLESREHGQRDICTWLGVPPHMAGVASKDSMTYSNVQQDQAMYKARALMGWIRRIEATLSAHLPLDVTAHLDDTQLDRGDPQSVAQTELLQAQADSTRVAAGILHPDEARAKIGLAPRDDIPARSAPRTDEVGSMGGPEGQPDDEEAMA